MLPRGLLLALVSCCALLSAPSLARASGYTDLNTGIAAENEDRHSEAIAYLSLAIASPDLPAALAPVAYIDRAKAYLSIGRFADAVKDCDTALRLKRDWYEAYVVCGAAHGANGDGTGAVRTFSAAIALRPDVPRGYLLRAFAYSSLEKYEDAVSDDNKAIALNPEEGEAYADRASNYDLEEKFDLALTDWTAVEAAAPNDYHFARAIGVDDWALGKYSDATLAFTRAEHLAPDSLYSRIWLDIVEVTVNPGSKPDRPSPSAAELDVWPGPVLKFYAGEAQPAEVMASARRSDSQTTANEHACEGDFYVGEWQKLHGAADAGKAYFEDAKKICPHNFIEYVAAGLELRHVSERP